MSHFSAEEFYDYLYLVALSEKLKRMIEFCVEIVCVDTALELNFLKFDNLSLFALFLFTLFLFEAVLAVVHDLTYGGYRIGSDLDKVELGLVGKAYCFGKLHYAKLIAVRTDNADLVCSDFFID